MHVECLLIVEIIVKNMRFSKKNTQKVSIVVPVYNKEKYLEPTIFSLLGQSYKNLEIILVDDGSTDRSPDILRKFSESDSRITVCTQENSGLSCARNAGLKVASGIYVMFFDADDMLYRSSVSKLLDVALKDDVDIVAGLHERINITRKPWCWRRAINKLFSGRAKPEWNVWNRNVNLRENVQLMCLYRSHISVCNKLFRREFLIKNELEFVPGLYMQDLEFWLRVIFISNNVSFTPYIVSRYWVRNDGAAQYRSLDRFVSLIHIYESLQEFYSKNGLQEFEQYRNEAIVSAAVTFFMKWFLEEIDNDEFSKPRHVLSEMLSSMPEEHFGVFMREQIGPVLLAFREKKYSGANALLKEIS